MKHPSVVVLTQSSWERISGSYFHIYELGLFLQNNGFDVFHWTDGLHNELDYTQRYTTTLPCLSDGVFPKNFNFLSYVLPSNNTSVLDKAKNIFLVVTDGILNVLAADGGACLLKYKDRLHFLYDTRLNNLLEGSKFWQTFCDMGHTHAYNWGVSRDIIVKPRKSGKWFMYAKTYKGQSQLDVVERAKHWAKENKIHFIQDMKCCLDPWNEYDGLLYTRNVDYSGRIMFEFSLANKPVVMFDSDPSFRNLTHHQIWNYPYVIEDIPEPSVDIMLFKQNPNIGEDGSD